MSTGSREKGRKREFPRGAEGVGWGALPSSGSFWASSPDTARSPPQADPGLSPLWRADPCASALWMWREPAVMALQADLCPWRWHPWRRMSALLSCSWCWESSKTWQELVSQDWGSPLKVCFSGASVYTTHLSGALWAICQRLWGSHRVPCGKGSSSTPPLPCFPFGGHLFFIVFCFSLQVLGSRGFESWERCTEAFFNKSNHQVLLEILCSFGNFYISWGKKLLHTVHCFSVYVVQYWDGWDLRGERSEDKMCLWKLVCDIAQWLMYL